MSRRRNITQVHAVDAHKMLVIVHICLEHSTSNGFRHQTKYFSQFVVLKNIILTFVRQRKKGLGMEKERAQHASKLRMEKCEYYIFRPHIL